MNQLIGLFIFILGISYSSFSQRDISYDINNNGENLSGVDFNEDSHFNDFITEQEQSKDID